MFPLPIVHIICAYASIDVIPSLLSKNTKKIDHVIFSKNPYAPPSYIEEILERKIDHSVSSGDLDTSSYLRKMDRISTCVDHYLKNGFLISSSFPARTWRTWKDNISSICSNPYVPEEFFESHICEVDWNAMGKNGGPSDNFFIKHKEKYQRGNENFKIVDGYLSRSFVSQCRLPPQLIREYGKLISLTFYASNPWISEEILRENVQSLGATEWYFLCGNSSVSIEFLLEHKKNIDVGKFISTHRVPLSFIRERNISIGLGRLRSYPLLPIDDISNIEDMNRQYSKAICKNVNVTEEWLVGMASEGKKLWWGPLSANPAAPMKFMERNEECIHWPSMCSNPSAPVDLILRNVEKIHWNSLCGNSQFWKKLIEWELREVLLSYR